MKTGIVVNNYDPKYKNRCQIRIMGLHTEKVGDKYVILDDDLPWASPAPNTSSNGTSSVPAVGSRVYVDDIGKYNFVYYGQVELKANVKRMMNENAESSDKMKVIAYSEDFENGENDYLKIYYLPEKGLVIECHGHKINLTKYDGLLIESKHGAKIEMDRDNNINISSNATINLNCDKVNLSENASKSIIPAETLMQVFNSHTHLAPLVTTPPIEQITPMMFSQKVKIN